ncbi:MAG: hypothetical protein ACOY9J_06575 [Pseudomonadota bacterium]
MIWVIRRQTGAGPDAAESVIGEFSPGARTPLLGMGRTDIRRLLQYCEYCAAILLLALLIIYSAYAGAL